MMDKGIVKVPERRERDAAGRGRHGDSAIAGALACFASHQEDRVGYLACPRMRDRTAASAKARGARRSRWPGG